MPSAKKTVDLNTPQASSKAALIMKAIMTRNTIIIIPNPPGPTEPDEENKKVTTRQTSPARIFARLNSSNLPMSGRTSCNR